MLHLNYAEEYKVNQYNSFNILQNLNDKMSKETPQEKAYRKSRSRYDCSPKLRELINKANLLPKGFHFDLVEAAQERNEKYKYLISKNKLPSLDSLKGDIDALIAEAIRINSRMKVIDTLFDLSSNHRIDWYEFFRKLPNEVQIYLMESKEAQQFYKNDSYSYWENNEDYANERLEELYDCGEITEEEYRNALEDDIASLLVEKGYYGGDWSYHEQKMDDRSYDKDDNDSHYDFYLSIDFAYYVAYSRLEEARDFIHSIIELQEKRNETKKFFSDLFDLLPEKLSESVRATKININENGEIQFSLSEWAEILQGVDITRIRKCEVCEDVFWANRKDAYACSLKHSKVRQMRLLRENWKEKGDQYLKARKRK